MEKIIELINEYQKEKHPDGIYLPVVAYRDWIFFSDWDCLSWVVDEIHLISKPYWFIKWLVENDKIDYKKLRWEERYIQLVDMVEFDWSKRLEVLLMLLAIKDEPINFLISILK